MSKSITTINFRLLDQLWKIAVVVVVVVVIVVVVAVIAGKEHRPIVISGQDGGSNIPYRTIISGKIL